MAVQTIMQRLASPTLGEKLSVLRGEASPLLFTENETNFNERLFGTPNPTAFQLRTAVERIRGQRRITGAVNPAENRHEVCGCITS